MIYILEADNATPRAIDLTVEADVTALFAWQDAFFDAVDAGQPPASIVAQDEVAGWTISTVFLMMRHVGPDMFNPDSPLVLWETMVFAPADAKGSDMDEASTRYTSRADAEAGHAAILNAVREVVTTPDSLAEGLGWNPEQ